MIDVATDDKESYYYDDSYYDDYDDPWYDGFIMSMILIICVTSIKTSILCLRMILDIVISVVQILTLTRNLMKIVAPATELKIKMIIKLSV